MQSIHQTLYSGLVFGTLLVGVVGCSHTTERRTTVENAPVAPAPVVETHTTVSRTHHFARMEEINFKRGTSAITNSEKKELDSVIKDVRENGKIREVKVLAWADRSYDIEGEKAPKRAIQLADARSKAIETYLSRVLKVNGIDTHNMAKQPSAVAKLFNTEDYELKTGMMEKNGTIFRPVASPEKAVVLVEYEAGQP